MTSAGGGGGGFTRREAVAAKSSTSTASTPCTPTDASHAPKARQRPRERGEPPNARISSASIRLPGTVPAGPVMT